MPSGARPPHFELAVLRLKVLRPGLRPQEVAQDPDRLKFVSHRTAFGQGELAGRHLVYTLAPALEQVEILTDQRPDLAVVDRGYRGHGEGKTRVLINGTRRGLTPKLMADLRRRSAIEAEIGHMKTDGRLSRSPLKGILGDALFAVLCGCGHNIRKIPYLRALLALILPAILAALRATDPAQIPVETA